MFTLSLIATVTRHIFPGYRRAGVAALKESKLPPQKRKNPKRGAGRER